MARKRSTPRKPASDGDALFRAILDEPADDDLRLVYADWCEENGDAERAEFIRLQVARWQLPRTDPARWASTEREEALLTASRERWLASVPEAARRHLTFERGFPGRAECEVHEFITWGADVWRAAPITAAHLADTDSFTGEYREPGAKEADMRTLAEMPALANVRVLVMGETATLRVEDVRVLLGSRRLTRLEDLALTDTPAGDELGTLLVGARLPALRTLNVEANGIGDAGAAALARSRLLGRLTSLCLGNGNIGDDGAEALAGSRHAAGLESLHLYCNQIGDRGALALAASPHLGGLKALSLMSNEIGEDARTALLDRFGGRVQL
jgi:uncharacterized protein (TIGR02996 family)